MIYKSFQNLNLPALGFGTMRLPVVDGDNSNIDINAVREMVAYAMEHGVNYFDTAWGYHDGNSELAMGKVLADYPRDSFYLADKFPGYDSANVDKVEEIFEKQLVKCGVDYFDFYLVHNVCELTVDAYMNPEYGILDYLIRQKKNGRIRHLGFSAHGALPVMKRFLAEYGSEMEFCQLQINYLDWTLQNGREKAELVREYNLPLWIMEPLRGGQLASLAPEYADELKALRPDETVPAWAFRFLQSLPDVTVTLSGMSDFDQLRKNIATFEEDKPLSDEEMTGLLGMAHRMLEKKILPCTACRYCTTHCPMRLDIPDLLALYNDHCVTGGSVIVNMAINAMPEAKKPSVCVGCRRCEQVCPQQIKISEAMADFAEKLDL